MGAADIVSLVASIVSVVIGVFAIWLSVVFYRWSSQASESQKEAAKDMRASVDKLEQLFDRFYGDTFSMMKETYSDIRRHMWPEISGPDSQGAEDVEKRADEKVAVMKQKLQKDLAKLMEKQSATNERLEAMSGEIQALLNQAITETRKVEDEALEETARDAIVRELNAQGRAMMADQLIAMLNEKYNVPFEVVQNEAEKLRAKKIVAWNGTELEPDTRIELVIKSERRPVK